MSSRRDFVVGAAAGLPLLLAFRARPRVRTAAPIRVAFTARADAFGSDSVRGAHFAAEEAAHTARLLGRTFELVEIDDASAHDVLQRAHTAGCRAIVAAVTEPIRSRLLCKASAALPVFDAAPGDPADRASCGPFAFSTAVPLAEAARALATAHATGERDDGWSLVPTADGALAVHRAGAPAAASPHVAVWHPDLFRFGATQLNERYRRRFGAGMSSAAWAAWIAVKAIAEVALRAADAPVGSGIAGARFDGHKGVPLAFRASDGWLRQPLYVVRPNADGAAAIEEVASADGGAARCSAEVPS